MILPVQDTNCINCGQLHIFLLLYHALDIVGLVFLLELPQLRHQTQLQLAYVYFSGMRIERKKCLPFINYRQYLFIASDFREGFFFFQYLKVRLGYLNPYFQNNNKQIQDTGCLGLVHWDDPEGW